MTDKTEHVGDVLAQALCDTTPRQLYQRAVRAEAAHERAQHQANDALSEAARLKERVAELEAERDEHAALDAEIEAGIEQIELERDGAIERAKAAEARERAKDEALREALSCLESPRASVVAKINAALTQQPADPVVSQNDADPSHNAACVPQDLGDRPKCSHTRLTADRCPICGPLDSDNRPITDGDTARPDPAAALRSPSPRNIGQAHAAAWPEQMCGAINQPWHGLSGDIAAEIGGTLKPDQLTQEWSADQAKAYIDQFDSTQPAQGERLDPHTLERAAQVAETLDGDVYTDRAPLRSRLWAIFFPTISLRNMAKITRRRVAGDIRNLRDGGDT